MDRKNCGGDKNRPSRSFVTGAVALAFLIIGYQTALFIHRAASLRILASTPDTVYVDISGTEAALPPSASSSGSMKKESVNRRAEVRSTFTPRSCMNFPFDPNTVSVEDLKRLGFSQKQAASIENYRAKGGRFRRKSDFAKSYVVADSVYRRLEPYIVIPKLDLNSADSAEFCTLPGIGAYFASRMVKYRKLLGGYSDPEQLMEIYHFSKERYDAICDLVEVASPPEPFRLWSLPADSLKLHPHIHNYSTARAIVLYRENNPASALTVSGLAEAGVIDRETAEKLSRCVIR